MSYAELIDSRRHFGGASGFEPLWLPDFLYPFQRDLTEWGIRQGRGALFADCGLGKTPMELVWAANVARKTNGRVLILTPLAVAAQTAREAKKFGIEVIVSRDGNLGRGQIIVTNYEQLERFKPSDFVGCVCDESSILKNFSGARRNEITRFMRKMQYRLLATATAAPNDYIELGTSSQALGYLGHSDMLQRFFVNDQNTLALGAGSRHGKGGARFGGATKFRFKGHAELMFWRWVCSWARALRSPQDMGYADDRFDLPALIEQEHMVDMNKPRDGMLFALPAFGLREQREERRMSIEDRCARVAELVAHDRPALVWCHLNAEGDLLEKMIPDAVQVYGSQAPEEKEARLLGFASGDYRVLITKPKIGAWGLNYQHCAHVVTFPSHSFEQHYQSIRRCWRFGQARPVHVDIVTTEGEVGVLKNLQRKAAQASRMFDQLIEEMHRAESITITDNHKKIMEVPAWLSSTSS